MTTQFLEADLERDEGYELLAYRDSRGNITWGIGHKDNSVKEGTMFTPAQVDKQFQEDLKATSDGIAKGYPHFSALSPLRQDCLVNMAFNLGVEGLLEFKTFLHLLSEGQYYAATNDLQLTAWYSEVGDRAERICKQLLTNVHQE